MKTRKLFKVAVLSVLTLAATSLSSCLKDSRYVDYAGATPFVELPLAASSGSFQAAAYAITTTPTTLLVAVNYAAPKTPSSPITVTMQVNSAAVTAYNSANSTNYTQLPAADYSIPNLNVTIPAGQNVGYLTVLINTSLVDPAGQFLLPITIASANGVAISTSNTLLYNVQAKNQYDGNYVSTGYVFHPSSCRSINATYAITTAGAASVKTPMADLGASNYYFICTVSGTSLTNWVAAGATPAAPASGFMTSDNPNGFNYGTSTDTGTGNPPTSLPGGTTYNITNYPNTCTVGSNTKATFLFHFGYQSGSTGQSGYQRQFYMKSVQQ
jgi:hypothetical protein